MTLEQLPVDARLVVVPLEVGGRGELDQVAVAGVVGGEQREVRVPLRLRAAVVGNVDLAAEQRLDAVLLGLAVKLDRASHGAVVGEPESGPFLFRSICRLFTVRQVWSPLWSLHTQDPSHKGRFCAPTRSTRQW